MALERDTVFDPNKYLGVDDPNAWGRASGLYSRLRKENPDKFPGIDLDKFDLGSAFNVISGDDGGTIHYLNDPQFYSLLDKNDRDVAAENLRLRLLWESAIPGMPVQIVEGSQEVIEEIERLRENDQASPDDYGALWDF